MLSLRRELAMGAGRGKSKRVQGLAPRVRGAKLQSRQDVNVLFKEKIRKPLVKTMIGLSIAGILITAGCGHDKPTPKNTTQNQTAKIAKDPVEIAKTQITDVYTTFSDAYQSGDFQTACSQLTPGAQHEEISTLKTFVRLGQAPAGTPLTCEASLEFGSKNGSGSSNASNGVPTRGNITKIDILGDTARVITDDGGADGFYLKKSGGSWKLAAEYLTY